MKQLIQRVKDKRDGLLLGEPWSFRGRALGGIVPILNERPVERGYITHPEIVDGFDITDTGRIERMDAENQGDLPVFLRTGSVLTGTTQTRGVTDSIIVFPGKERVPVQCIYQTRGIRTGARAAYGGTVPHTVAHSLTSWATQAATWSAVSTYTASMAQAWNVPSTVPLDDIGGFTETAKEQVDVVKDFLKEVPEFENQVGMFIFVEDGVLAMEMFDHPDSWHAFAKDVAMAYSDVLSTPQKERLWDLRPDALFRELDAFMDTLIGVEGRSVWKKRDAETWKFHADFLRGEWTDMGGRTIHLLSMREKEAVRTVRPGRHWEPVRHRLDTPRLEIPSTRTVSQ